MFEGLDDEVLAKISIVCKEVYYPKNHTIFKEGDIGDAFYIIKNGKVEIGRYEANNYTVIKHISHQDKDNFFGEMALIANTPRNATVKTLEDSEFLVINKTDFEMMLRLNSFISLRIMTALTNRFRTVLTKDKEVTKNEAKVIVVFSPKSGAGKTIFSVNLADGISRIPNTNVMLIDLDLQFGDIAFIFGIPNTYSIVNLINKKFETEKEIKNVLYNYKNRMYIIPAPIKPEQSEIITYSNVRELIELAKNYFDYVVIDTHSFFNEISINAMDIADFIYIISLPVSNHIKSLIQCLKVIENLKYPTEKVKVVINRVGMANSRPLTEIIDTIKTNVNFTILEDNTSVCKLVESQQTLFEISNSLARDSFIRIIEDITKKEYPIKTLTKSWWAKLFGM